MQEYHTSDEVNAYIAGFIDGEGSLFVHKHPDRIGKGRYQARIAIYQSNIEVLEFIQAMFGGNFYNTGHTTVS